MSKRRHGYGAGYAGGTADVACAVGDASMSVDGAGGTADAGCAVTGDGILLVGGVRRGPQHKMPPFRKSAAAKAVSEHAGVTCSFNLEIDEVTSLSERHPRNFDRGLDRLSLYLISPPSFQPSPHMTLLRYRFKGWVLRVLGSNVGETLQCAR